MATAKEQLARYKSRSLDAIRANRASVKETVHRVEAGAGSFLSGALVERMPEVMGIPTDAAAALLLLGIGIGMKQKDVTSFGLGFAYGYLRDMGREAGSQQVTPR